MLLDNPWISTFLVCKLVQSGDNGSLTRYTRFGCVALYYLHPPWLIIINQACTLHTYVQHICVRNKLLLPVSQEDFEGRASWPAAANFVETEDPR